MKLQDRKFASGADKKETHSQYLAQLTARTRYWAWEVSAGGNCWTRRTLDIAMASGYSPSRNRSSVTTATTARAVAKLCSAFFELLWDIICDIYCTGSRLFQCVDRNCLPVRYFHDSISWLFQRFGVCLCVRISCTYSNARLTDTYINRYITSIFHLLQAKQPQSVCCRLIFVNKLVKIYHFLCLKLFVHRFFFFGSPFLYSRSLQNSLLTFFFSINYLAAIQQNRMSSVSI